MKDLTEKQKLFCLEYLKDMNGTRAYQAVYKHVKNPETACANASETLRNPKVRAYIDAELEKMQNEKTADAQEVMEYLTSVLRGESQSEEAIGTKNGVEIFSKKPNERDRLKAAEMIAKRYGLDKERDEQKEELSVYRGIKADDVSPAFMSMHHDIRLEEHQEYVLPGGRGSTKSSFIALEIIDLLEKNPEFHAVVVRRVGRTMRDSVFNQLKWAIERLGLDDKYSYKTSPIEITKMSTNQKIYFRGADDPTKMKSLKPPFGHVRILWFEELDQFQGPESVRKIEQSVIRGGDKAFIFKSFNPPRTKSNWANQYILIPKDNRLVVDSNYLSVPADWLGLPFIEEAEFLQEISPYAYENEYLGVANGSGGNVFENLNTRELTDEEIDCFDKPVSGVDFGWYPDPFAFVRCYYDSARLTLYIFDEFRCNKKSNEETADVILSRITTDTVYCDSAERKSIADFRRYGIKSAREAQKGPGSREYSYKWLQSLKSIVIDPVRCPETLKEFVNYEYERDKDGNVISGYPDGNDHSIDAVRYAMSNYVRKRPAYHAVSGGI